MNRRNLLAAVAVFPLLGLLLGMDEEVAAWEAEETLKGFEALKRLATRQADGLAWEHYTNHVKDNGCRIYRFTVLVNQSLYPLSLEATDIMTTMGPGYATTVKFYRAHSNPGYQWKVSEMGVYGGRHGYTIFSFDR